VNFAGDASLIGRYVEVEIAAALPHSLRGRLTLSQQTGAPVPALQE
jgi:hypothetical protein